MFLVFVVFVECGFAAYRRTHIFALSFMAALSNWQVASGKLTEWSGWNGMELGLGIATLQLFWQMVLLNRTNTRHQLYNA